MAAHPTPVFLEKRLQAIENKACVLEKERQENPRGGKHLKTGCLTCKEMTEGGRENGDWFAGSAGGRVSQSFIARLVLTVK
jgi:hypothetical protein